jgi:flagellin-like protein
MRDKRGISPVIATVLLVALVIVLILIIFIWSKAFISESVQKGSISASNACKNIQIDISPVPNPSGSSVDLQVVNRGSVPIYKLDIKSSSDASSTRNVFDVSVDVGSSGVASVPVQTGVKFLTVYPVIVGTASGKNKAYTCLENGKVINL